MIRAISLIMFYCIFVYIWPLVPLLNVLQQFTAFFESCHNVFLNVPILIMLIAGNTFQKTKTNEL